MTLNVQNIVYSALHSPLAPYFHNWSLMKVVVIFVYNWSNILLKNYYTIRSTVFGYLKTINLKSS